MIEFAFILLAVLATLFLIGKVSGGIKSRKQSERTTNFVALANMQAVQASISGDKKLSETYSLIAQNIRDAAASVYAGQLLHPATKHKQVQALVLLIEEPSLFLGIMAGQDEVETARTHVALKDLLAHMMRLSRRG